MNRHHMVIRLAALVASACAAIGVASLATASSALAAAKCASGGYASGSSLQSEAWKKIWLTSTGWGKHLGACSSLPTITYTATSSGEGLDEFGNNNGTLDPNIDTTAFKSSSTYKDEQGTGAVLDWFVGSDDAPNNAQDSNAEVASGDKKGELEEIAVPVAEAPVSVIFSLPAKCTIAEGTKLHLSDKTLVQIWEGTQVAPVKGLGEIPAEAPYKAATWGSLLTLLKIPIVEATECENPITLQARETESGTSYAFKSFLALAYDQSIYNTTTEQFETRGLWDGYITDAPTWPSTTEQKGNAKGSNLVQKTAENPGSIGYANTADAVSSKNGSFTAKATSTECEAITKCTKHEIVLAEVENNEGKVTEEAAKKNPPVVSEFANPASGKPTTTAEYEANEGACQSTAPVNTDVKTPYSYTDPWYGTDASDPDVGVDTSAPEAYPICAFTYVLTWHHYSAENLFEEVQAEEISATMKSLLEYITGPGQAEAKDDYDPILSTPTWKAHVGSAVANVEP
jgi:hypothetical protein